MRALELFVYEHGRLPPLPAVFRGKPVPVEVVRRERAFRSGIFAILQSGHYPWDEDLSEEDVRAFRRAFDDTYGFR